VLKANGIESTIQPKLSEDEANALANSAAVLKAAADELHFCGAHK
jgi:malate/lactate dehydrogenase